MIYKICNIEEPIEGNTNFICPKCKTNHMMTFKYFKMIVKEAIDTCPIRARAPIKEGDVPTCLISIQELYERLGL